MRREVPVTVRVPAELKERVDTLAAEVGISSSAVWKILLHRSVKPLMNGETFRALDIFGGEDGADRADRAEAATSSGVSGPPGRGPLRRLPR